VSAPPKTVLQAAREEEAAIRAAIREARGIELIGGRRVAADLSHVATVTRLLSDSRVSAPIYSLPQPVTEDSVAAWITGFVAARERGEGLLMLTLDEADEAAGYTDAVVWPERASGEIGGAIRADMQSAGQGGAGALRVFGWLFESVGVRLMCLTAAPDNVRSQKLIDAAGFVRMGERDSVRPDGSVRRSVYWEMTREAWRAKWGGQS
jgi:RimJ/RimL family protein N-acetyltransferase